ncbi:MAG: patatin-like phospholipase family protein, partial [Clostridia bacterium]|nr:patatin-like phospholipase family protein [Clostridia bacterium]
MKRRTLGLALGAGSTKGFAHIGVLQVLEERGSRLDMIAGCSMGAIIGGMYAVGGDMRLLHKYLNTLNLREFLDIGSPFNGGLLKGRRIQELLQIFTHNKSFDQTRLPFCCVAVDAESGELKVFDEGRLHEAIRASMSMPAFFQPAHLNGRTYIDGG